MAAYLLAVVSRARFPGKLAPPRFPILGGPEAEEEKWLGTIIGLLVLFWVLRFAMHFDGALIHFLLVAAVVVFVLNMLTGRRTVR